MLLTLVMNWTSDVLSRMGDNNACYPVHNLDEVPPMTQHPAIRILLLIGAILLAWPMIVVHAVIAYVRLIVIACRNQDPQEIIDIALTMRPSRDRINP